MLTHTLTFMTVSYQMKNNTRSILHIFGIAFCLLFVVVSCKKEDNIVGFDMLHASDLLTTYVDSSTTITFSTVQDDSVRSSLITYMVGENYDANFGKSRAGYATRMYLTNFIADINSYSVDSVCIRLSKSSEYAYGDKTVAQSFSIYELNNDISVSDCANYNEKLVSPSCLSAISSATKILDVNFPAYQDSSSSFLYKIDASYGKNLFESIKSTITTCYSIDSTIQTFDSLFIKTFKGIYVTTQNNTFNGVNSVVVHCIPEISFYLKNSDTTNTLVFSPSPQAYNNALPNDPSQIYLQAINVFEHENASGIVLNDEATEGYVQGFAGLKTKLTLSGLEQWRENMQLNNNDPMQINFAKLTLPLKTKASWSEYLPLNLRVYDANRKLVYSTLSYTTDSSDFQFNFHPFLLQLYENTAVTDDYSYEVTIPQNNAFGNSIILDGTQADKLKLVITYTK